MDALAEAAQAYVNDAFGAQLALSPVTSKALPHFILDKYRLWQGQLQGQTLLVMASREALQGSGANVPYLKHRDLVRREFGADVVLLLLDRASGAVRRQMIERRIGFLAPGAQIYVPEAFLDLRERAPAAALPHSENIRPTAQLLLLAHLHGQPLEGLNLTELADTLHVSIMSLSRTLDELEAMQLAKAHHVGRQRRLHMLLGGRKLWDKIQGRLQSPLRKVRVVSTAQGAKIGPLAGESALARYTMLGEPQVETRAILGTNWKGIEADCDVRPATPFDDDRVEIQTWTYDPQPLAENGTVDRLSLYLTFRNAPDERVAQAADELLETFAW
ncbi:MAG: hypothetical protein NTX28_07375 [Novosphingobium sp.]|nr:hypothetical protein [Novosphingobium sp.]